MVANYEYDPYGNQTNVAGTYEQPFRFSGKYHDAETGLGYWGYRYYNPVLGRWINRDPLGEPGGLNLYTYCGNEPAGRFDALGLSDDEDAMFDDEDELPISCYTECFDQAAYDQCVRDQQCELDYYECQQAADDARAAAEAALFARFQRRLALCGGRFCRAAAWTFWTATHAAIQITWAGERSVCELGHEACLFGCRRGTRTIHDGVVDCPPGTIKTFVLCEYTLGAFGIPW
jgi:RHS repeat-associated protein